MMLLTEFAMLNLSIDHIDAAKLRTLSEICYLV